MEAVQAIFNGHEIEIIEPIPLREKTEVLVILPDHVEKVRLPEKARELLRGSGKGEKHTEMLIKSRIEDIELEGK